MKSAMLVLGSVLVGLGIIVSAFFGTIVLVEYIYLDSDKAANHDGQGGIAALIYGVLAGVPAALCAGYFWLADSLNRMLKTDMIPAANK